MTPERFEEIKKKYEQTKEKASRAEGARDQLMARLKTEYNITSLKALDAEIEDLDDQLDKNEREIEKMGKELEAVTNWDAL